MFPETRPCAGSYVVIHVYTVDEKYHVASEAMCRADNIVKAAGSSQLLPCVYCLQFGITVYKAVQKASLKQTGVRNKNVRLFAILNCRYLYVGWKIYITIAEFIRRIIGRY